MGSGQERVSNFVKQKGLNAKIVEFDSTTKSSALAARELGCSIAEIAKSVVFRAGQGIIVVISGDKRVDKLKLSRLIGKEAITATAREVRQITGYPAGGVPPFPHYEWVRVVPDSSLRRFREVWAAAGQPNSVMKLATSELLGTIGTGYVDVAEE